MKQSSLDLNLSTKKTRKQELLAQVEFVAPWAALVDLIAPYYSEGKSGRPLCARDHAAHPLHAAMVQLVGSGHGGSLL